MFHTCKIEKLKIRSGNKVVNQSPSVPLKALSLSLSSTYYRIPRYSQRLRILYFIKTRDERLGDIEPRVQSVLQSCREVISSGKLRKVLEVVLAFGNFMNQGRRGNAFGFKLSSLNNILDTKSSTDREVTLLHYIVKTLESKVR